MRAAEHMNMDPDAMLIRVYDEPSNRMNYADGQCENIEELEKIGNGEFVSRVDIESGNVNDDIIVAWNVIFENISPELGNDPKNYAGLSVVNEEQHDYNGNRFLCVTYTLIW